MRLKKEMGRIVKSIGRRRSHELLFLLFVALMLLQNTFAKASKDERRFWDCPRGKGRFFESNTTLDRYNFTTEKQKYFSDRSEWGSRILGRLLTPNIFLDYTISTCARFVFDCGKCSLNVKNFEIKYYGRTSSWITVKHGIWWYDGDFYGTAVFIQCLYPRTEYVVRAQHAYSTTIEVYVRTCSEHVPMVRNLYIQQMAATWIDVRFETPTENCVAKYFYKYVYYNTNGTKERNRLFSNVDQRFGMYYTKEHPGRRWVWASLHPCPTYPKEHCALIAEHVYPDSHYVVQVRAERFITRVWSESGNYLSTYGNTNRDYGLQPTLFCPPRQKILVWLAAVFGSLIFLGIAALIVVVELIRRFMKKHNIGKGKSKSGKGKKKKSGKDKKKKSGKDKKKKSGKGKKKKSGKGKKKKSGKGKKKKSGKGKKKK